MESFKHLLKKLSGGWTMKIQDGPLKGLKWSVSCGKKFIEGRYEQFKTDAYLAHVKKSDVVFDVGAHTGYYSAIASKLVLDKGKVFAFEPRPLNLGFLKKHVRINRLNNIKIFELGAGNYCGKANFDNSTGTGTGHISLDGKLKIEIVTLDDICKKKTLPLPDFLKIDVEGGEMEVLKGASNLINRHKPKMLVAVHSIELHKQVQAFLEPLGYKLTVLNPGAVKGDTEILALQTL